MGETCCRFLAFALRSPRTPFETDPKRLRMPGTYLARHSTRWPHSGVRSDSRGRWRKCLALISGYWHWVALPGAAPAHQAGMDFGRGRHLGKQSPGQVLPVDTQGPKATGG